MFLGLFESVDFGPSLVSSMPLLVPVPSLLLPARPGAVIWHVRSIDETYVSRREIVRLAHLVVFGCFIRIHLRRLQLLPDLARALPNIRHKAVHEILVLKRTW
jgi:hypothetical protein